MGPYPGWDHDLTIAPDGSKYHIKDVPSYGTSTTTGITHAKKANKPFFLNVNISDPHKPFWKPGDQTKHPASKTFKADEVPFPGRFSFCCSVALLDSSGRAVSLAPARQKPGAHLK